MKLGIVRLYIGKSGERGYYNIQEIGLAKALEKRGIEVDIFFLIDKKTQSEVKVERLTEKIRVVYIPANKIFNHGIVSPKFLLEYGLDIVEILSDNQIMTNRFNKFLKKNNFKFFNYIGTIESDTNNKMKKILTDLIKKINLASYRESVVIVKTEKLLKDLEVNNINHAKIIPVGLDQDIIPNINQSKEKIRIDLKVKKEKKVLLFVGRLEEYKNPEFAINLIEKLIEKDKEYYLIIIGQGGLKNKLLKEIKIKKLEKNIKFIEKIENKEIHKYYKISDFFINLNSKEIFGMSILEAMNQGSKVIAVSSPGVNYIIENNVDGIIMENFEVNNWIKRIEDNYSNEKLEENAKIKIYKHFNWKIISEKYIKLFEKM